MKSALRWGLPLKRAARNTLARLGLSVTSYKTYEWLVKGQQLAYAWRLLLAYPELSLPLHVLKHARSQSKQDLFVLLELSFKTGGFFVEFGAADGVAGSNSYLLEKQFGWTGILAEPARVWHQALAANRSARLDERCVWSSSGARLDFNEAEVGQLSTIASFSDSDQHKRTRRRGRRYEVETVSLIDLLEQHGAPQAIDYLSIDTEGSELAILQRFDFNRYRFRVITIEHNYQPQREAIHSLLVANGYVRKFAQLSQVDDWYVSA